MEFCTEKISKKNYGAVKKKNGRTQNNRRQTENVRIVLPLLDLFLSLSREAGFSGCQTQWSNLNCENGMDQSIKGRKMLTLHV